MYGLEGNMLRWSEIYSQGEDAMRWRRKEEGRSRREGVRVKVEAKRDCDKLVPDRQARE